VKPEIDTAQFGSFYTSF